VKFLLWHVVPKQMLSHIMCLDYKNYTTSVYFLILNIPVVKQGIDAAVPKSSTLNYVVLDVHTVYKGPSLPEDDGKHAKITH